MNKWRQVNPTDYLFFDSFFQPLSSVKLNQRLNKLFDNKRISVNALRHSYLSNKYQNTIDTNKALANDLTNMGSSIAQQKVYIKRNNGYTTALTAMNRTLTLVITSRFTRLISANPDNRANNLTLTLPANTSNGNLKRDL